jgi:hypothetical protein
MKHHRRFLSGFFGLLVFLGGCELLTWPFALFQELLPIAIKYAPYALMFLEAPEVAPETEVASTPEVLHRLVSEKAQITLSSFPETLQQDIQNRNGKPGYIFALFVQSEKDWSRVQSWVAQHKGSLRLRCVPVFCDVSNEFQSQQIQAILAQSPNIAFYATGPLHKLSLAPVGASTKPIEEVKRLVKILKMNTDG